jgi:FkbM family methyltransferase
MAKFTADDCIGMMVSIRELARQRPEEEELQLMSFFLRYAADSRSQILQDLWVAYETGRKREGFFVEFGATDGVKFSNTHYLENELGWTGILAEPGRVWHEALGKSRRCAIDERCVWKESGHKVVFNEAKVAVHSTIDIYSEQDGLADSRQNGLKYEVETVSLNDLLAFHNAPRRIDYLSIDTEGSEVDILSALDFEAWDIRLITVEHNHTEKRAELVNLLGAKGYRRKFRYLSNVDDWYVKAD